MMSRYPQHVVQTSILNQLLTKQLSCIITDRGVKKKQ